MAKITDLLKQLDLDDLRVKNLLELAEARASQLLDLELTVNSMSPWEMEPVDLEPLPELATLPKERPRRSIWADDDEDFGVWARRLAAVVAGAVAGVLVAKTSDFLLGEQDRTPGQVFGAIVGLAVVFCPTRR